LGTHNDVAEGGDNADIESQLLAQDELTQTFKIGPSTNGLVATTLTHVFEARWPIEIIEVNYVPDATCIVNATNYVGIRLKKGSGTAVAATVVASSNSAAGSNMAIGTPFALTLSGTAANLKLATTNTLAIDTFTAGTDEAKVVPQGRLVVHYRRQ
jgi:hypothetical protein